MKKAKSHDPDTCKRVFRDLMTDNARLEEQMSKATKDFRRIFTLIAQGDTATASNIADASFRELNEVLRIEFDNEIIIIPKA